MESMRLPALPMGLHPSITRTPASTPGRPPGQPCQKGTDVSIAITVPTAVLRRHARIGGPAKDERKLFGYARVSVGNDANNLENQRRVVADCEQGFKGVGSGASWNRPRLYRRKAALSRATG